jgi:hypothetical protein
MNATRVMCGAGAWCGGVGERGVGTTGRPGPADRDAVSGRVGRGAPNRNIPNDAPGRNVELYKRIIGALGEVAAQYAMELVDLRPDLLVAGPTNAVRALQRETHTVPIVFVGVADAVEPNLSRPGGNLTGFSSPAFLIVGKALEMFKEIAPDVTRIES